MGTPSSTPASSVAGFHPSPPPLPSTTSRCTSYPSPRNSQRVAHKHASSSHHHRAVAEQLLLLGPVLGERKVVGVEPGVSSTLLGRAGARSDLCRDCRRGSLSIRTFHRHRTRPSHSRVPRAIGIPNSRSRTRFRRTCAQTHLSTFGSDLSSTGATTVMVSREWCSVMLELNSNETGYLAWRGGGWATARRGRTPPDR